MSFDEKIAALIQRLPTVVDHLETEEATKNALIMPFIAALGYDIFNPKEVIPEFTADFGSKKGEKVDYAILNGEEIILLFECKKRGTDLGSTHAKQLYHYFSATEDQKDDEAQSMIPVLTNGVQYRFYEKRRDVFKNIPFLTLNLDNPRPNILREVKRFAKDNFDISEIVKTASELKNVSIIKKVLSEQYESPDEEFCKYFFGKANSGVRFGSTAKDSFKPLVKKALNQFVDEKINDRLDEAKKRYDGEPEQEAMPEQENNDKDVKSDIETTQEELEAFWIVRAIAFQVVKSDGIDRIVYRDAKTYMSVLFDDNNRKPVCRFWFNTRQKYLGTFDSDKNEIKNPIENLSDIYQYSEQIIAAVQGYIS